MDSKKMIMPIKTVMLRNHEVEITYTFTDPVCASEIMEKLGYVAKEPAAMTADDYVKHAVASAKARTERAPW